MVRLAGKIPSRSHFWIVFDFDIDPLGALCRCIPTPYDHLAGVENQELAMDSSASPILLPSHCMTTKIYPPIYPLWGIAFALVFDYTFSHDEPLVDVNG